MFRALLLLFPITVLSLYSPAGAQNAPSEKISAVATHHAKQVANHCVSQWEAQSCLSILSHSALILASNYASDLQDHEQQTEDLKQHCAAATAATKGEYPAYAMTSAYTECANIMTDIAEQTGIAPDPSHYQLLIGSILCLNKSTHCPQIETALKEKQ